MSCHFLLNFHEKLYALKLELNIETPHWSYILLAVQVYIQRTVLGLASSKAGHGCQRYFGKFIKQTM